MIIILNYYYSVIIRNIFILFKKINSVNIKDLVTTLLYFVELSSAACAPQFLINCTDSYLD